MRTCMGAEVYLSALQWFDTDRPVSYGPSGMNGRVPEREGQRRLALFKAAFREVAEKGFAEVTLDDIARRAGVSKGVTLYYFASKEDLFRRLFGWLVDSIHARMREAV